jgi:hypothetical protein
LVLVLLLVLVLVSVSPSHHLDAASPLCLARGVGVACDSSTHTPSSSSLIARRVRRTRKMIERMGWEREAICCSLQCWTYRRGMHRDWNTVQCQRVCAWSLWSDSVLIFILFCLALFFYVYNFVWEF